MVSVPSTALDARDPGVSKCNFPLSELGTSAEHWVACISSSAGRSWYPDFQRSTCLGVEGGWD